MKYNWLGLLTQDKFKAFVRKSLKKSDIFIGHVYTKIKRDA